MTEREQHGDPSEFARDLERLKAAVARNPSLLLLAAACVGVIAFFVAAR